MVLREEAQVNMVQGSTREKRDNMETGAMVQWFKSASCSFRGPDQNPLLASEGTTFMCTHAHK